METLQPLFSTKYIFPFFLFLKGLGHKIYSGHVCVLMSYRFGGFCLNVQRFCQDVGSLF